MYSDPHGLQFLHSVAIPKRNPHEQGKVKQINNSIRISLNWIRFHKSSLTHWVNKILIILALKPGSFNDEKGTPFQKVLFVD